MAGIYPVDTDAFNAAEDLIRAVLALASGAQWDGARTVAFHGAQLRCAIVDGAAQWTVDGAPSAPAQWFERFGLRPILSQRDVVDAVAARVARAG